MTPYKVINRNRGTSLVIGVSIEVSDFNARGFGLAVTTRGTGAWVHQSELDSYPLASAADNLKKARKTVKELTKQLQNGDAIACHAMQAAKQASRYWKAATLNA